MFRFGGCTWCHPGGGPVEYDREGYRYDANIVAGESPNPARSTYKGDYYVFDSTNSTGSYLKSMAGADAKGVAEADCLMCHYTGKYNNQDRDYCMSKPGAGGDLKPGIGAAMALTLEGEVNTTQVSDSSNNPSCDILGYADGVIEAANITAKSTAGCAHCHFPDMAGTKGKGPAAAKLDWTTFQKFIGTNTFIDSDTGANNTLTYNVAKGRAEFGKRCESINDPGNPDAHMDSGAGAMTCADCHYALEGSFSALEDHDGNVIQAAVTIQKIDHQFAKGNNLPDSKNMDQLDNTVTCASCHTTRTHPNLTDNGGSLVAPTPSHSGFPAGHLSKIDCRVCHIPELNFVKKQLVSDYSSTPYPMEGPGPMGGIGRGQFIIKVSGSPQRIHYKPLYVWTDTGHDTGDMMISPVVLGAAAIWKNLDTGLAYSSRFAEAAAKKYREGAGGNGTSGNPYTWTLNSPQGNDTALIVNTTDEIAGFVSKLRDDAGIKTMGANMTSPALNIFINQFDVSHNVKPISSNATLGHNGCTDCHSTSSPFFSDPVTETDSNSPCYNQPEGCKGLVFFQPNDGGKGLEMTCDGGDCDGNVSRVTATFGYKCSDSSSHSIDLTAGKAHGEAIDNVIKQTDVLCYSSSELDFLRNYAAANLNKDPARFNWYKGAGCYSVNFDASDNDASDFDWDFGTTDTANCNATEASRLNDQTPTCVYEYPGGTFTVKLTLDEGTVNERSRTMLVTATGNSLVPHVSMSVSDNSSDTSGMSVILTDGGSNASACGIAGDDGIGTILWGDGTTDIVANASGKATGHTYGVKGTYTVRYSFKDANGNKAMASPVTVTVPQAGEVFDVNGTIKWDDDDNTSTPKVGLQNVTVQLKDGSTIVRIGRTLANGVYTIRNVPALAGGATYTVVPKKNGFTFTPVTDDQVKVGDVTADFNATSTW